MNERVIFQSSTPLSDPYTSGGTLSEWQEHVGRYALGNSRLVLAMCAAFAGPMLKWLNAEGGGFHFRGGSSTGKTTALHLAGSAWGGGGISGIVRSWRATSNGLEGVAALHSETLLCLDEIGQIDAREASFVAYMLANGTGKSRAGRAGEARLPAEWRVIFLSSGEISLAQKIGEDHRNARAMAGQEVRVVDIPADCGQHMGIFEDLHGFHSGDEFARYLRAATSRYYGHAALSFISAFVQRREHCIARMQTFIEGFRAIQSIAGADGQVSRVLDRFAIVAAAGELATELGVLPWTFGDGMKGVGACFSAWLDGRGGVEAAEDRDAITLVRRFLEMHGSSRFEPILTNIDEGDAVVGALRDSPRTISRFGFVQENGSGRDFYFLPESWREVCSGHDAGRVAKVLAERGFMQRGGDGKVQVKKRLPGISKPVRCYIVSSDIFSHE